MSPRLSGIREHLQRARFFASLAGEHGDAAARYRLRLAAVYSCRAIVELMLEMAERQEAKAFINADAKASRNAAEAVIAPLFPHYALIERIRIHDFHRFGIAPPDPQYRQMMFGGPVKMTAHKGGASVSAGANGPALQTSGGSFVKMQRPLMIQDGAFFDDERNAFVAIDAVVDAFLAKAPAAIEQFERLL